MAEVSLELLQAMVQRVLDNQEVQAAELREIRERLSHLERGLIGIRRDLVGDAEVMSTLQTQITRLDDRMVRVEQRLELRES
jgi:hypothetical protein